MSKGGQHTDSTLTVEVHGVEYLAQILHITTFQTLRNRQDRAIDILGHEFLIFLDLHTSDTGKRIEVGSHLHQQLTEGSSSHFVTQHIFVHDSPEAHNLSLCKTHLFTEAGNASREVHQVASRSRRILG